MNIRSLGAELFHANRLRDVRTDVTKLTVAFRNFVNARKKRNRFIYNTLLSLLLHRAYHRVI